MLQRATRFALAALTTALTALGQSASPNMIVGAGYVSPTSLQVSPGQVITIYAAGVGSSLTQPVLAGPGNLPTSLAGITVTIRQVITATSGTSQSTASYAITLTPDGGGWSVWDIKPATAGNS